MTSEVLIVWCQFPSLESARQAATAVINQKLAACVNILPGGESHYLWKENYETTAEILTIWKTTITAWPTFLDTLKALHPYDTPEIIAHPITHGLPDYLHWVVAGASCSPAPTPAKPTNTPPR